MTAPVLPAIVTTRIRHRRTTPIRHGFSYRSVSWLIDLDDPPRLPWYLRWCADFRAADHFPDEPRPGQPLRDHLAATLRRAGVAAPGGRVIALTSPRVAGYAFNPLSVFWCHDRDGTLTLVVAEVHNTYRQRHVYVVELDDHGNVQVPKEFYVSPFNDVDGHYRLHLPPPYADGGIRLSITLDRPGQRPFVATLTGTARPATVRTVIETQLRAPLAPLVVSLRIRKQGILLWLKRIPVIRRPAYPTSTTVATTVSTPDRQPSGVNRERTAS